MKGMMLDIETLSTKPNAAVLSIGLAAFDDERVIDTLGIQIDPEEVFGDISTSTVRFWVKQSAEAQVYSFEGKTSQYHAAWELGEFFRTHKPDEVWANSPQFDLIILESWWSELIERGSLPRGTKLPWTYRQPRDCRTMFAEARRLGIEVDQSTGTLHNPVDDAANQARAIIQIRQMLSNLAAPMLAAVGG